MKIGPREQIGAVAIGVVAILVALVAFLIWPQVQKLGELDTQIATAQQQVSAAKGLVAQREQSKQRAADTDASWLRLSNLIPEGPDLPSLIIELQDVAFASGVQLVVVTPSTPVKSTAAEYYTVPVQLEVIGTWADTVDYMQRLYKLNRGLRIVEFTTQTTTNVQELTKENETLPDYAVHTIIKVAVYTVPASSSSTPTPTPAPAAKP